MSMWPVTKSSTIVASAASRLRARVTAAGADSMIGTGDSLAALAEGRVPRGMIQLAPQPFA